MHTVQIAFKGNILNRLNEKFVQDLVEKMGQSLDNFLVELLRFLFISLTRLEREVV
jgi:hypothetical protein